MRRNNCFQYWLFALFVTPAMYGCSEVVPACGSSEAISSLTQTINQRPDMKVAGDKVVGVSGASQQAYNAEASTRVCIAMVVTTRSQVPLYYELVQRDGILQAAVRQN